MVDCARMLNLDDPRWETMTGGYKMPFDPRLLLKRLETEKDPTETWHELWTEIYHQGDVGDASFASIPHLVRIYRSCKTVDWNTYAMVAIVELARSKGSNPDVPEWLKEDYFDAIQELAEIGLKEFLRSVDPDVTRAILSILAIAKGLRRHGDLLINYSEDEMSELQLPF
jgi:hypothetical protein